MTGFLMERKRKTVVKKPQKVNVRLSNDTYDNLIAIIRALQLDSITLAMELVINEYYKQNNYEYQLSTFKPLVTTPLIDYIEIITDKSITSD
jgi:hypothetical protein